MKIASLTLAAAAIAALGTITAAVAQPSQESRAMASQSAPSARPGDADGAFVALMKFSEPDGEKLYRRICAGCHMPDAKGAKGAGFYPALAGNEKLAAGGYPTYIVLHGLNGMPAVGRLMSDQQVADVVNYVRTHFGNKYKDAVTVADVKSAR
jgi:mono/diheme cytochrome c family protein